MKCTYGFSSRLPAFFDRKYFSCSQGCLTRNIGDMCEEESLIIETVQKTLTPLLERAVNRNGRFMKVLENSHMDDDVSKKFKNPQVRKKMKRRKKRKPTAKCDIIRQGDVYAHKSYTVFENEFLLCNNQSLDADETTNESVKSYDNNSYSHVTSEKESAYSEAKLGALVRKRKKLQRRKKKKQNKISEKNSASSEENDCEKEPTPKQEITGQDNLGSYDEDETSLINPLNEIVDIENISHDNKACNVKWQSEFVTSECKKDVTSYAEMRKTVNVQLGSTEKENKNPMDVKNKTISNSDVINNDVIMTRKLKLDDGERNDKHLNGPALATTGPSNSTFSREQKRQFRKKMKNAKKCPESYVVLGLI